MCGRIRREHCRHQRWRSFLLSGELSPRRREGRPPCVDDAAHEPGPVDEMVHCQGYVYGGTADCAAAAIDCRDPQND